VDTAATVVDEPAGAVVVGAVVVEGGEVVVGVGGRPGRGAVVVGAGRATVVAGAGGTEGTAV
jgi:hypothetical protein